MAATVDPNTPLAAAPRKADFGYSRFVHVMKRLLPALAAALMGLVFAWPQLSGMAEQSFSLSLSDMDPSEADTLTMNNPRFFGSDTQRRLFFVTANSASQVESLTGVVTLDAPRADMTGADGKKISMDSRLGYYSQEGELLDLLGGVDLYHQDGYQVHTTAARISLKAGRAEGDTPVQAHGSFGEAEGEGFVISDHGRVVHFTGQSRAVLKSGGVKQ
ncbi:LPS export ABC transporter periplasmic protein LptC [Telmatospirillum sp. J64-1]|uniref:LPS export ABC transporter periplasmic protein LptC n=1 Tax=Telmatospirillum sp. J64-1 TaxID=2502183 RepID=UPI00115CA84B|nr:LPS export ABC transporter periplasmic protein LptC [Telmatospirillum sp. J64-1]